MKIQTVRFGEVEINESDIFTAVRSLPGFPDITKYFFIETEKIAPFKWLQSFELPELTFVVVEPEYFFHDYEARVNDIDLEEIELDNLENVRLFAIVVLPEDLTKMTANLKGPLLFNSQKKIFKQAFLETDKYTVRESIVEGIKRKEEFLAEQREKEQLTNTRRSESC